MKRFLLAAGLLAAIEVCAVSAPASATYFLDYPSTPAIGRGDAIPYQPTGNRLNPYRQTTPAGVLSVMIPADITGALGYVPANNNLSNLPNPGAAIANLGIRAMPNTWTAQQAFQAGAVLNQTWGANRDLGQAVADAYSVMNLSGIDNSGATDISSIIQSAANAYQVLYFPCGTYKLGGVILTNGSFRWIAAAQCVKIIAPGAAAPLTVANSVNFGEIAGFLFLGSSANNNGLVVNGFNVKTYGGRIEGWPGVGFLAEGPSSGAPISGNDLAVPYVLFNGTNVEYHWANDARVDVGDNGGATPSSAADGDGIDVVGSGSLWIRGGDINGNGGVGFSCLNSTGPIHFIHNHVDQNAHQGALFNSCVNLDDGDNTYYSNSLSPATTTLSSGIGSGATSAAVGSTAAFPGSGNFVVTIDSETLLASVASSSSLNIVAHSLGGTTAASHSAGATVTVRYEDAKFTSSSGLSHSNNYDDWSASPHTAYGPSADSSNSHLAFENDYADPYHYVQAANLAAGSVTFQGNHPVPGDTSFNDCTTPSSHLETNAVTATIPVGGTTSLWMGGLPAGTGPAAPSSTGLIGSMWPQLDAPMTVCTMTVFITSAPGASNSIQAWLVRMTGGGVVTRTPVTVAVSGATANTGAYSNIAGAQYFETGDFVAVELQGTQGGAAIPATNVTIRIGVSQ